MAVGHVNDNYFHIINSEDKAYFLGFMMADGCILKGSHTSDYIRVGIHLNIKDIDIIEKFKYYTGSDHKIFIGDKFNDCALRFVSRKMIEDLTKLGVTPKKTGAEKLNLSGIELNMHRHIIRGLIDGDGWISFGNYNGRDISSIGLCGSYYICDFVQSHFHEALGTGNLKVSKVKDKDCYKIGYSSLSDQKIIANYLYSNANVYLNRKYELAKLIMI